MKFRVTQKEIDCTLQCKPETPPTTTLRVSAQQTMCLGVFRRGLVPPAKLAAKSLRGIFFYNGRVS
jgi:hypothetical protein